MKGILRNIGVLGLACFSFLITDETIQVVKEKDELMIEIKNVAPNYHIEAIDAKISDKYIKIGLNGLTLDIDATYNKMKRIGYFNENMLVYKNVLPNVTIDNYKHLQLWNLRIFWLFRVCPVFTSMLHTRLAALSWSHSLMVTVQMLRLLRE